MPELIAYVLAQFAGGISGSVLAHGMFELPLVQFSATARTGPGQWLGEMIAAFGLLLTIFGGVRFRPPAVPWCVGLYITAAYWFTSSTSFANPAVTVARGLSDTFAGIRLADVPAFIVAQLAGALAASLVGGWLFAEPKNDQRSDRPLDRVPLPVQSRSISRSVFSVLSCGMTALIPRRRRSARTGRPV